MTNTEKIQAYEECIRVHEYELSHVWMSRTKENEIKSLIKCLEKLIFDTKMKMIQ